MISVAGLAASALAQPVVELRLVVDGTPGAPNVAGITYSPFNNSAATPVGITVQARVLRPDGATNWGISGMGGGAVNSTPPDFGNPANISVNDPGGNGLLQRGQSSSASLWGAFTPFRGLFQATENSATSGNNRATGNATGAQLPSTLVRNGFIDTNASGDGRIRGMDLGYGTAATGRATPIATRSNDAGATDNWQNLYRFVFVPDSASARDVIITISAVLRFFETQIINDQGTPEPEDDQYTYIASTANFARTASITLTYIPAPGAAALLGLGGLVAARRRRA
jgi:hypothetical protein